MAVERSSGSCDATHEISASRERRDEFEPLPAATRVARWVRPRCETTLAAALDGASCDAALRLDASSGFRVEPDAWMRSSGCRLRRRERRCETGDERNGDEGERALHSGRGTMPSTARSVALSNRRKLLCAKVTSSATRGRGNARRSDGTKLVIDHHVSSKPAAARETIVGEANYTHEHATRFVSDVPAAADKMVTQSGESSDRRKAEPRTVRLSH